MLTSTPYQWLCQQPVGTALNSTTVAAFQSNGKLGPGTALHCTPIQWQLLSYAIDDTPIILLNTPLPDLSPSEKYPIFVSLSLALPLSPRQELGKNSLIRQLPEHGIGAAGVQGVQLGFTHLAPKK